MKRVRSRILITVAAAVGLLVTGSVWAGVLFGAAPAKASQSAIQYLVVPISDATPEALQGTLDQYGADGWQLIELENVVGHFIFQK